MEEDALGPDPWTPIIWTLWKTEGKQTAMYESAVTVRSCFSTMVSICPLATGRDRSFGE